MVCKYQLQGVAVCAMEEGASPFQLMLIKIGASCTAMCLRKESDSAILWMATTKLTTRW